MFRQLLIVMVVFVFLPSVYAQERLTGQDILRVKAYKHMIRDIDDKSLQHTLDELEKAEYPEVALALKEAMAKAYVDIVREQNVQELKKKQWLYSMVNLNMAYLQFVGLKPTSRNTDPLNKLIRQRLKTYLSPHIINQPGFHCSIE